MSQIFSQSKIYRNINLFNVTEISEEQAHELFCRSRWGGFESVVCPFCGTVGRHYYKKHRRQWRCKGCHSIFSVTTETPLADRKLPFKKILVAMFLFVAAPKSESANKVHSMLGVTLRTIYILFGKLREALWEQRDTRPLAGIVHIDGGHFCGKPRRPRKRKGITSLAVNSRLRNRKASIVPPQRGVAIEPWNAIKLKNRRVVLVLRQMSSLPHAGASKTRIVIVKAETAANVLSAIRANVAPHTTIMTDDSQAYTRLGIWFDHHTVRHSAEYATYDGVNQNQAESYMARLRRAEYGVFHGMRRQYFALYAYEMAWREDIRQKSLQEKFTELLKTVMRCGLSKTFRGYNQGHRLQREHDGLPLTLD
ncbi:IS1595 family transposase [Undibacterium sp. CY21W]|uniref:IS1595 family transposase n=1 Tax=Undibacterium sp. CY21W TaxID=2762293 RepID=UPI00164A79B9|nr:IS1595 family transposase [Undibacterium sp. CY21W]MBC3926742.1 IS1595 family transposase [Undibacterium sp. CY21W]